MKAKRRWLVINALVVLWIAVVYAGYYAVHKPVVVESFGPIGAELERLARPWSGSAIADSALNLVVAVWIAFVAYGIGWAVLRLIHMTLPCLEDLVLSASLGLGAISLATFFIGIAGLLYPWVFIALFSTTSVLVVAFWAATHPRGISALLQVKPRGWFRQVQVKIVQMPADRITKALAIYIVVMQALPLLSALVPPWAWDSMVYHLTGPELYLRHHRIVGGIDGMHFYFPSLVEMLFLVGMLVKGPIVANLIHWEFGLLATGAVFCFASRFFNTRVAWLSAAVLLSVPSIAVLSSKAYVDLALILYSTLAFWLLMESFCSGDRKRVLLAAVFLGFAAGVKYTAAGEILAIGAVVLVELGLRHREGRTKGSMSFRLLAACCLVVATLAAPWYLKNLAFTGNPFYPFVFGGQSWDSFRTEWVTRAGSGLIRQPFRLVLAPVEATILGVEGGLGYQASVGPLFLVLLPLLVFVPRRKEIVSSLIFVGTTYLVWLVGVAESDLLQQTRLLFPVFGVLSVLSAYVLANLKSTGQVDLRRLIGGAIAIAMALAFVSQLVLFLVDSPLPFVVGAESERDYLSRHLGGYYDAVEYVNGRLDENAKVFFMWEPRSYYFQRETQPDTILDNWRHLLFLYREPDAILRALQDRGYTHVLISLDGLRYFMEEPHREVEETHLEALLSLEKWHFRRVYGGSLETVDGAYFSGNGLSAAYYVGKLE